jgi:hypothetical protein
MKGYIPMNTMMSNYSFSQLMPQNFSQLHDASLKVSAMTPRVSNTGDEEILGTAGGATLADSSVVPSKRSQATTFSVTSRSQTKVAARQLGKENN